eukprot:scaffold11851_cov58-Attheya_sp.AAC.3
MPSFDKDDDVAVTANPIHNAGEKVRRAPRFITVRIRSGGRELVRSPSNVMSPDDEGEDDPQHRPYARMEDPKTARILNDLHEDNGITSHYQEGRS